MNTLIFVRVTTGITPFGWEVLTSYAGRFVWAASFGYPSGGLFTAGTVAFQATLRNSRPFAGLRDLGKADRYWKRWSLIG